MILFVHVKAIIWHLADITQHIIPKSSNANLVIIYCSENKTSRSYQHCVSSITLYAKQRQDQNISAETGRHVFF